MYVKNTLTKLRIVKVAPVTVALGAPVSQADIIIDDFTSTNPDPHQAEINNNPPFDGVAGASNSSAQTGLTNVIGDDRQINVTRSNNIGTVTAKVTDAEPLFQYESSTDSDGTASIHYGFDTDLNFDFSTASAFRIDFDGFDVPGGNPLTATIDLTSGGGPGSSTQTFAMNGGNLDFSFGSGGFALIDFSDVDSISITFDAPQGGDFKVNDVTALTAIPEVSSNLALCSLLLLGLICRRR